MFDVLLMLTGAMILVFMAIGYARSRDPLSPMVVFAPMLMYSYVYNPAMMQYRRSLQELFPETWKLEYVQTLVFCSLFCFCLGAIKGTEGVVRAPSAFATFTLSEKARKRIYNLAWWLGVVAIVTYFILVFLAGGFWEMYSHGKGGRFAVASGYISELPMMAYPAIILMAVSLQGRPLRMKHIALALLFATPHLALGLLGGRRGPTFLISATLFFCWYLIKNRRPAVRTVLIGVFAMGMLLLWQVTNRHRVYLGSEQGTDWDAFSNAALSKDADNRSDWVYQSGLILTTTYVGEHYWGSRFFVQFVARPIPRQIMPDKYSAFGMRWMRKAPGSGGFDRTQWQEAVGFQYLAGSACGFVADLFLEFSWGCLIAIYFVGRWYSFAWKKWVTQRGIWSLVYLSFLALSVYLPTQSIGACLYRAMLLNIPLIIFWRFIVVPALKRPAFHSWAAMVANPASIVPPVGRLPRTA